MTIFASKLQYVGYTIDKDVLHTTQANIRAINNVPTTKNVSELKSLVGFVNYYAKFVQNIATVLNLL